MAPVSSEPSRVVDDAPPTSGSRDDSDFIFPLLPQTPPYGWDTASTSTAITRAPPPPAFSTGIPTAISSQSDAGLPTVSLTVIHVFTPDATWILATPSRGVGQTNPSWPSLYRAERNATRPMKMLAAVFGTLALILVIIAVSIVVCTRIIRRRRARRTPRVRSVVWTGSRELVLCSNQTQPYATPGQERWAKQWEELSHPAVTPRQPEMTNATLTSTRTRTIAFLANTLSGRWSRSLTNDSPGNPPSYRSPSYGGSNAEGNRNGDAIAQSP